MKIFIVCPVYNEEEHIEQLLHFFRESGQLISQILLIDGGSSDRTKEIINADKNPKIKLLDNINKTVPYAMNLAVDQFDGDVLIRLDAHTKYSHEYIVKIIEVFERTDADIVGGPMRVAFKNSFQEAVKLATTSPFGIGDSKFHFEDFEGYTDSVYLGAWKKEVFEKIGNFDVKQKRNQDDEFHYRAKSAGLKIYQSADIKSWYFPRSNLRSLFKQYFQYGLYKPMVLRKVKSELKVRHLVPACFVFYLIVLPVFPFFLKIVPILCYLLLAVFFVVQTTGSVKSRMLLPFVFLTLHLSYGLGFIFGLFKAK